MIAKGLTWQQIAGALGFKSRQAAQQWYKREIERPRKAMVSTLSSFTGVTKIRIAEIIADEELGYADPDLITKVHEYIQKHKCKRCGTILPRGFPHGEFCSEFCNKRGLWKE